MAALGLRCFVRAFLNRREQWLLFPAVCRLFVCGGFSCGAGALGTHAGFSSGHIV